MNHQRKAGRGLKVLLGLGLTNLGVCVIFPNCGLGGGAGGQGGYGGQSSAPVDYSKLKPISEFNWNSGSLWQKIGSNPDTYVPKGYATTAPAEGPRGTWFVDSRNGRRLFAPSTSYNGFSANIWRNEARKITDN